MIFTRAREAVRKKDCFWWFGWRSLTTLRQTVTQTHQPRSHKIRAGTGAGLRIRCCRHCSRSHDSVIRVYDAAGNVVETHEHPNEFREL